MTSLIHVKLPSGDSIDMKLEQECTVEDVRRMAAAAEGLPEWFSQHLLLYNEHNA